MKQYKMLAFVSRVCLWLGALGVVITLIALFWFIIQITRIDLLAGLSQLFQLFFASLLLLAFADLISAVLEIHQRVTEEQSTLARIEIKINQLNESQRERNSQ